MGSVWTRITADRRRFGLLCITAALGLLLWARIIVISNLPRMAVADNEDHPAPGAVDPSGGNDGELDREPRPETKGHIDPLRNKSPVDPPEDSSERAERHRAALRARANELGLEAVMTDPPSAVIDGRTVRPGQRVSLQGREEIEFTLAEVKERSVILEFEGYEFELRIPAPSGR